MFISIFGKNLGFVLKMLKLIKRKKDLKNLIKKNVVSLTRRQKNRRLARCPGFCYCEKRPSSPPEGDSEYGGEQGEEDDPGAEEDGNAQPRPFSQPAAVPHRRHLHPVAVPSWRDDWPQIPMKGFNKLSLFNAAPMWSIYLPLFIIDKIHYRLKDLLFTASGR